MHPKDVYREAANYVTTNPFEAKVIEELCLQSGIRKVGEELPKVPGFVQTAASKMIYDEVFSDLDRFFKTENAAHIAKVCEETFIWAYATWREM